MFEEKIALNVTVPKVVEAELGEQKFHVVELLSYVDSMNFVEVVVSGVFDEDGVYHPENFEYSKAISVILYYTDIDLPDDPDEIVKLIYGTDVMDVIHEKINRKQFSHLMYAVDDLIEYKNNVQAVATHKEFEKASGAIDSMMELLNGMFGDMKPEDVAALSNALVNGKIDEEKLVDAIAKHHNGEEAVDNIVPFEKGEE